MKAVHFPQANKVLKAPPSHRAEIQSLIDKLAAKGADMAEQQAKLDAVFPPDQEVYDLPVWGGEIEGVPRCISCWEPTPEDRTKIAAGGPVWLWVMGHTHPPLVLDAASPFEPASSPELLTPEERQTIEIARIGASHEVDTLLAIIDRLTGREAPASEAEPEPEWVDTTQAEEEAERLRKLWPLPYRPGSEVDEP